MSDRFFPLDGSVLLRSNGTFSEHQIYHNSDREVFARKGNGYIRLMDHAATSVGKLFWSDLISNRIIEFRHGRMILPSVKPKRAPVSQAA